jgi:hypothetical protein
MGASQWRNGCILMLSPRAISLSNRIAETANNMQRKVRPMPITKLSSTLRAFPRRDLGVDGDAIIIQKKFAADADRPGWQSVAECHASVLPLIKRDGIRAHAELIRVFPAFR